MTEKEMQYRNKQEVKRTGELTKTGLTFIPAVDIFESEEELTLMAEMPGVGREGFQIELNDNQITISGEVDGLTGPQERPLLKEFETGRYYRQFSLSDLIDQNKISARLKNGVLKVILPKIEKAKPRRIEVSEE
jgi:HSP20 family protein